MGKLRSENLQLWYHSQNKGGGGYTFLLEAVTSLGSWDFTLSCFSALAAPVSLLAGVASSSIYTPPLVDVMGLVSFSATQILYVRIFTSYPSTALSCLLIHLTAPSTAPLSHEHLSPNASNTELLDSSPKSVQPTFSPTQLTANSSL